MHKIFAKPIFLGKKVVFLPECHSTNDELMLISKNKEEPEGFVIYTDHQLNGRGQRGNVWITEPKKNVLMSILLKPGFLLTGEQYLLNLIIGNAVLQTIQNRAQTDNIKLKWPNDVYVGNRKISGILIECDLQKSKLDHVVVGIGINLNQQGFNMPSATSLAIETGMQFDRDDFMGDLLVNIERWYLKLKSGATEEILEHYHNDLFLMGETGRFRDSDGEFNGIIKGVDYIGRLLLEVEGIGQKAYTVREIKFLM